MNEAEFNFAIAHIEAESPGKKWPHGFKPMSTEWRLTGHPKGEPPAYGYGGRHPGNEKEWNSYIYNPPEFLPESHPDRDASPDLRPKPTWGELQIAARHGKLAQKSEQTNFLIRDAARFARQGASDESPLEHAERSYHVGDGINHMTGLLQMVEQADAAGQSLPHIVLRTAAQEQTPLFTRTEVRAFLSAVAVRENIVESAHNVLMARYYKFAAVRDDETRELPDRESAAESAANIAKDYEAELRKEIALYRPDTLPTDLPTFRNKLCERVEEVATGRQKHLKGAFTQHAIDNWAQCTGIGDALTEVATQCAIACIAIQRAADTAAAQAAYDAAVKAIEAVTAVHTPVWVVDGVDYSAAQAAPVALAGSAATVTAKHPAGQDIDGQVVLTSVASAPVSVAAVQTTDAKAHSCKFTVKTPVAGETVTLFLTARSLCGPSELEVHLTP